jgi:hypothetical protein
MNRLWWAAPVLGLGVCAWWWSRPEPHVELPPVPVAQAEPMNPELAARLDQLSARQSRLASEVAEMGSAPAQTDPAAPAPEGDPGVEAARVLDEALAKGRDPGWSSGAEDVVIQHIEATPGLELQDVECGQKLCRIELAVTEPGAEGLQAVQHGVPWHAPAFISIETAAMPPTAVLYVAREGTTLPIGG